MFLPAIPNPTSTDWIDEVRGNNLAKAYTTAHVLSINTTNPQPQIDWIFPILTT